MRYAGIVDEDRHGAERLFRGIESARHRRLVRDVRLDGERFPALSFDLVFQRLEAVRPPRHQHNNCAVIGKRLRKLHAKAARRAGHQRHAALQAEYLGGLHSVTLYTCEPST